MAYNLLTECLIRATHRDGTTEALSLPGVFAALIKDQVTGFPALRPHQRHAWHAFLAQLGAMALHKGGVNRIPADVKTWQEIIRDVGAEYGDDPWTLIVEDPVRPAFLQCPVVGETSDYKTEIRTPDSLDVLVSSKNHDEKQEQALDASPDDWIFALATLQTMAGFSGRGNYGIARMNGGNASRPCFGLYPATAGPGGHLAYDLQQMLEHRTTLLDKYPQYFAPSGGTSLLWLDPWDGEGSMPLRELDPYFIEICRRIRLHATSGRIWAKRANSKTSRIYAKEAKGKVGDYWTPIDYKKGVSLTASRRTVQYDKLAGILFDSTSYRLPLAMRAPAGTRQRMRVMIRGWVGGQGKTEGYFERDDLVFGKKTVYLLGRTVESDPLAKLVKAQLGEVESVAKALKTAIAVMANSGRQDGLEKVHWNHANRWTDQFHHFVDDIFFGYLDRRHDLGSSLDAEKLREEFGFELMNFAKSLFDQAASSMVFSSSSRHRAKAVGHRALRRMLLYNSAFGDDISAEYEARQRNANTISS